MTFDELFQLYITTASTIWLICIILYYRINPVLKNQKVSENSIIFKGLFIKCLILIWYPACFLLFFFPLLFTEKDKQGEKERERKGMLTYSSDLLPQIVCPMDEDAIIPNPFYSAPPHSEPPPPLLPLSSITPRYSSPGTFLFFSFGVFFPPSLLFFGTDFYFF